MERKIVKTADGSTTIYLPEWNEHYHSTHGAVQEAYHVFIKSGLEEITSGPESGTEGFEEGQDRAHSGEEQSSHEENEDNSKVSEAPLAGESASLDDGRNLESGKEAPLQDWGKVPLKANEEAISILEIGFGTGLNAYITLLEGEKKSFCIDYTGVEAFPVSSEELEKLNYVASIPNGNFDYFKKLHESRWEEKGEITSFFTLHKKQLDFKEISEENRFHLIYFDAFGPRVQPELWTEDIFELMYRALKAEGILVTYSAKGSVRRAMQAVGFKVERLPGPPGKREMLRARKK